MKTLTDTSTAGTPVAVGENALDDMLARAITIRVGEPSYNLWFRNRIRFTWEPLQLIVSVPNKFYQEWLQKRFTSVVEEAVVDVLGEPRKVDFRIDSQLAHSAPKTEEKAESTPTAPTKVTEPAQAKEAPQSELTAKPKKSAKKSAGEKQPEAKPRNNGRGRIWRKLSEFIVGPCNRVAYASAQAVAENPGLEVNPLVIYGPVGTGKSHLLEGIYLALRKNYPDWKVNFVTSEDFTNRFVQSMRLGKLNTFRKQFRECDALLMDDVHFLAKKQATQEEFLHTFDTLHAAGLQVVVTCDCHPRLNDQFMPELMDRLLGGAVWNVLPPDFQTRKELLRAKALKIERTPLPDEVVRFIADQLRGNVRELEGAINGLVHFSRVSGRRIDLPLAKEALQELLRYSIRVVQLPDIDEIVCRFLNMDRGSLQSKKRSWAFSHPRMVAMYLARRYTSATYSEIGRYFGNRTHGTVVAAEKKVRQWVNDDTALTLGQRQMRVRDLVERLERDLLS